VPPNPNWPGHTSAYLTATGQIPKAPQPFYSQLGDKGDTQILKATNPRGSRTSQGTLSSLSSPDIPYAAPYPGEKSDNSSSIFSSSSSAPPPIPSIHIHQRVQASVKNMSNSNGVKAIIKGTAVFVGQKMNDSGKMVDVVGICLDPQFKHDYGLHDCGGLCDPDSGIYVPIAKVSPDIQSSSSSATEGNLLDLDYEVGGRKRRRTRKIKKSRKTKKAVKKSKKSKKSRRSKK
jgi:hypothetical protein